VPLVRTWAPEPILTALHLYRGQSGMTLDAEIGGRFGGRKSSRSAALVAMMQSADFWERDDLACSGSVYRPSLRAILVEREMRSGLVIIVKIR
jgi:hypothetical protein